MSKKIMIVEDNEDMQILYSRLFLREKEIELFKVDTAEHALETLPHTNPDLIVLDISLPGISGLDLTKIVHENYPDLKIIIVTGHEVSRYYKQALEYGATDVISKDAGRELVKYCKQQLGIT